MLGPVRVVAAGEPVPLGGPGVRGLLAILLLRPNEVVPVEDILTGLWGDDPPLTARTIVQNYVSRLRRQLRLVDPAGSAWIATRPPGYEMVVDEDVIDVNQARALLARSRHEHPVRRAEMLREALDLWRGPVLADVSHRITAPNWRTCGSPCWRRGSPRTWSWAGRLSWSASCSRTRRRTRSGSR
ncbi:hypothetical protein GCM10029964_002440 [Kibdelosporangium lantanae]